MIGSSFYFYFLGPLLRKTRNLPSGVGGEAWNVHGGGFYLMQKIYRGANRVTGRASLV